MTRWSSVCFGFVFVTVVWALPHKLSAQEVASELSLLQEASQAAPLSVDEQRKRRASAHFERGVTLFRDGAYRAALIEFERAYETVPDYRLLYNQAQMHMLLQDYLGATRTYERYLAEGGERVPPERREVVEQELAVLRSRVAYVSVRADRDGARLYIDDVLVGEAPLTGAVPLNVGRHRIHAEAADGATAATVVDLAASEHLDVFLELRGPKVKTVVMREAVPVPTRAPSITPWAVTTTVAAGALTAGALAVGLVARSAERDLEDAVRAIPARKEHIEAKRESARRLTIGTDVLAGAALASAAAAVVLWAVGARASDDDTQEDLRVSARIGPNAVGLSAHF